MIFVITGPSGIGKSYLINEVVSKNLYPLEVYTDREKRPTESVSTDRVYLSKKNFTKNLAEFIHWFEFQGNRYGYKTSDIEKQCQKTVTVRPF